MGNKASGPQWQKCNKIKVSHSYYNKYIKTAIHENKIIFKIGDEIKQYNPKTDSLETIKPDTLTIDKSADFSLIPVGPAFDKYIKKLSIMELPYQGWNKTETSPEKASILFFINNTLHVIGGKDFPYHIDTSNISFEQALHDCIQPTYSFKEKSKLFGMQNHDLVYIKSKRMILLFFTGDKDYAGGSSYYPHYIYSYSLDNKIWKLIYTAMIEDHDNAKTYALPDIFYQVALIPGDRYIILLNKLPKIGPNPIALYVYDIEENQIYASDVKLPWKSMTEWESVVLTAVISDFYNIDLLICGYIHEMECIEYQRLSQDLIECICQYCGVYMFHIFKYQSGDHRKIGIDCILKSMKLVKLEKDSIIRTYY